VNNFFGLRLKWRLKFSNRGMTHCISFKNKKKSRKKKKNITLGLPATVSSSLPVTQPSQSNHKKSKIATPEANGGYIVMRLRQKK